MQTNALTRMALPAVLTFAFAAAAEAQEPESAQPQRCDCLRIGADRDHRSSFPYIFGGDAQLGVSLDSDDATDSTGARIRDVLDDGPAAAAGLRAGDVVTAIDGRSVAKREPNEPTPRQQLMRRLRGIQPGDTVRIDYRRDDQNLAVNVIATERQSLYRARQIDVPSVDVSAPFVNVDVPRMWPAESIERVLRLARSEGLQLADMNESLGEYFGVDHGVLVIDVHSDSRLGLEPGDVILRIGDRDVRDAHHARSIVSSYREDEPVQIEIMRARQRQTITGRTR